MEGKISSKGRFFQEPHGVTSQKTAFFIITVFKTSDPTQPHSDSLNLLLHVLIVLHEELYILKKETGEKRSQAIFGRLSFSKITQWNRIECGMKYVFERIQCAIVSLKSFYAILTLWTRQFNAFPTPIHAQCMEMKQNLLNAVSRGRSSVRTSAGLCNKYPNAYLHEMRDSMNMNKGSNKVSFKTDCSKDQIRYRHIPNTTATVLMSCELYDTIKSEDCNLTKNGLLFTIWLVYEDVFLSSRAYMFCQFYWRKLMDNMQTVSLSALRGKLSLFTLCTFWSVECCHLMGYRAMNRYFGGTYHIQIFCEFVSCSAGSRPRRCRRCIPANRQFTYGLHGPTFLDKAAFMSIAVRISYSVGSWYPFILPLS
jgi:hypothetical protein